MSETQKPFTPKIPESFAESLQDRTLPHDESDTFDQLLAEAYRLSEGIWLTSDQRQASTKIGGLILSKHSAHASRRPNRWE